jgi:sporulation protein YlmC with PRC-barrel domain
MLKSIEELKGMSVVGAGGRVFGEVIGVDVDAVTWRVPTLTVGLKSAIVADLGIDKPFWSRAHLVVHVEDIQSVTDVVVLGLTTEEFARRLGGATPSKD